MNSWTTVLGQSTQPGGSSPAASFFPIALMLAFVVFMLLTSRSQRRREQRDRDSMQGRLAKNHRVLTVGGIIGTVMSVKDDEVVLKVDETTNTKMTFLRSSIQRIFDEPSVPAKS
ncbi:MAG: preprotein translocase subunit YajC [Planctomycetota bacterium]